MAQFCGLVCVLLILLLALAATLVALLTDNWYRVDTDDDTNVSITNKQHYNFHYGLWRLCYDDIPSDIAQSGRFKKDGDCVFIHEELIQKDEEDLDYDHRLRLHLSRTVVGCSIAAAAVQLAVLASLLCAVWPGQCDPVKRPCLYLSTSLLLMLATMCGVASGVCFIALRDLDDTKFKDSPGLMPPPPVSSASEQYWWSFMVHWVGTGLAMLDSFILLCLLRNSYESINENSKFNRYSSI